MKFLIIGDIQAEDSLTFEVADYLWNKGNDIYLQSLDVDRSDAETPGLKNFGCCRHRSARVSCRKLSLPIRYPGPL